MKEIDTYVRMPAKSTLTYKKNVKIYIAIEKTFEIRYI